MIIEAADYEAYFKAVQKPFKKLCKLEFLHDDGSVAFALDNNYRRGFRTRYDTRAFIQSGSLNVSLQNGMRRKASVTLSNVDGAFDYKVNNLWFGQQVRLLMGLVLPNGKDFYLPQGVFYISDPQAIVKPRERTISLSLVDKWAALDGSQGGNLTDAYKIPTETDGAPTNIFDAMKKIFKLSRFDFSNDAPSNAQIDNVAPVFTTYYDNKTYPIPVPGGVWYVPMLQMPYTAVVNAGGTFADVIGELNNIIVGWIGYDQTGAFRVEAGQEDIDDISKPALWTFTPENSVFAGLTETAQNSAVFNNVIIVGQGLNDEEIWAQASNFAPRSDTNINLIGKRTFREEKQEFWNVQQCKDLARFYLKHKTILAKSITIECGQLFHLYENAVVNVQRPDKPNAPLEKHLIQSFTIPLSETGTMSIDCTSAQDIPLFATITSS